MPTTISPSDEACQALVARINSAITYTLPQPAAYADEVIDELSEVTGLRVDVVEETSQQLRETLDPLEPTSHIIRIWVRDKLPDMDAATVAPRKLVTRKVFERVNNFDSADGRVRVWSAGEDRGEIPGKWCLVKDLFFRAYIELRVEVAPA